MLKSYADMTCLQSGNYDYPPASNSSLRNQASARPQEAQQTRLQNLRDLILFTSERRNRERSVSETARALETLNNEIEQLQTESARRRLAYDQTRAVVNRQLQQFRAESLDSGAENNRPSGPNRERGRFPVITSTSSDLMNQESGSSFERPGRRWIRPSETSLARLRAGRINRTSAADLSELSDLEQAAARLREANATISSVLNEGISRSDSPLRASNAGFSPWLPLPSDLDGTLRQPESSHSPGSRWRSKRRKLESDDNREGLAGFSYGHYGQVVPGPLKMEISSCDGGSYYDEDNGESSWPGNVLLDDSSVYCTKKSRCNMILNHRGETPFSLKKIVIRAPKKGFDAAYVPDM